MGSRVFDPAVDSRLTVTHGAALNLAPWTVAVWVKRTGAGEGDFRIVNKAAGSAVGSLQVTGQSGAITRVRGRQATSSLAAVNISADGALPLDTWVCLFVTYDQAATPVIGIYKYDGVSAVTELTYSSTTNDGTATVFNTSDLFIGNTSDGSLTLAGKLAYLAVHGGVWSNADMVAFATGTFPTGTDFLWELQGASPEPNTGDVAGFSAAVTSTTFDGADSPPVTYGGGGQTIAVAQAAETDTAQPVAWAPKNRLAAQASETDVANTVTVTKTATVVQAAETDTAQPITALKTVAVAQVVETDIAQPVTPVKTVILGQAPEFDLAQPVTTGGLAAVVGQATETDMAQPITVVKTLTVGQVVEQDQALTITAVKVRTVDAATETDAAQTITAAKTVAVVQVLESDEAVSITAIGGVQIIQPTGALTLRDVTDPLRLTSTTAQLTLRYVEDA